MAERTEMPFGRLTHVATRNHILNGDPGQTNIFTVARDDKSKYGLLPNYLGYLLLLLLLLVSSSSSSTSP